MKIVFVRHGEGLDDVYEEYGGWNDRGLSPKGVNLAFETVKELTEFSKDYDVVLTSPLNRAREAAEIFGKELGLQVLDCPYLKERNGAGLLSGVNKQYAKVEYPEMVAAHQRGEYIPGAERYRDFVERVKLLMAYLQKQGYEDMVCVTHGHVITVIIEEILGMIRDSIGNGSILAVEVSPDGVISYLGSKHLSFREDQTYEKMVNKLIY